MTDELKSLLIALETEYEGIKMNLVKGYYSEPARYQEVLGEAKMLAKIMGNVTEMIAKRAEEEDDGDTDD